MRKTLPQSEVPDRVIELDGNDKTLDISNVEVFIADSHVDSVGDSFEGCEVQFTNPVWVVNTWEANHPPSSIIGTATLRMEGKSLMADLSLRRDTPERLSLETGLKFYPSICAAAIEYVPANEEARARNNGRNYKKLRITEIQLSLTRNADHRIQPICLGL